MTRDSGIEAFGGDGLAAPSRSDESPGDAKAAIAQSLGAIPLGHRRL
jgi:hypothetical protein